MAKEKGPRELGEIMAAEQLDLLRKPGVDMEDVRVSEAVANMVGKIQKQMGLEMAYSLARKQDQCPLPSLDRG